MENQRAPCGFGASKNVPYLQCYQVNINAPGDIPFMTVSAGRILEITHGQMSVDI